MTDDQTFFAGRRPAILAGDDLAVGAADAEPKRAHQDCAVGARRLWNVFKPHRTGNARRNCDCAHGALRGFGPQIEVQWRPAPPGPSGIVATQAEGKGSRGRNRKFRRRNSMEPARRTGVTAALRRTPSHSDFFIRRGAASWTLSGTNAGQLPRVIFL